jgi:hypothetical protein
MRTPGRKRLGREAKCEVPPRSRLEKLGVKPGQRIVILGVKDDTFEDEVRAVTTDVTVRSRACDLLFFQVDRLSALARLPRLRTAIAPAGAVWAIWRKGRPELGENAIRDAAIRHGLVDVKVVAFSPTLSGLKLVIPIAQREGGATRRRRGVGA